MVDYCCSIIHQWMLFHKVYLIQFSWRENQSVNQLVLTREIQFFRLLLHLTTVPPYCCSIYCCSIYCYSISVLLFHFTFCRSIYLPLLFWCERRSKAVVSLSRRCLAPRPMVHALISFLSVSRGMGYCFRTLDWSTVLCDSIFWISSVTA